jgi:general secretion pathway protein J
MESRALRAREFLQRHGEGGFTLLEVVLAFTILALLVAVLYGAFFVSHRAVEKAELRAEESQRVRAAEEFLGGYIRSAYPYATPASPTPFFSGDENRLVFVSGLSVGLGGRGMAKISLSWEASGAVVLEEQMPVGRDKLDKPDDAAPGYRSRLTLWQGVAQFRLWYLDGRRERETWVDRWEGTEQKALPRAVRLSVRDAAGGELLWDFPVMMRALLP